MSTRARSMTCTGINVTLARLAPRPRRVADFLATTKKKGRRRADESAGARLTPDTDEAAENGEPS